MSRDDQGVIKEVCVSAGGHGLTKRAMFILKTVVPGVAIVNCHANLLIFSLSHSTFGCCYKTILNLERRVDRIEKNFYVPAARCN